METYTSRECVHASQVEPPPLKQLCLGYLDFASFASHPSRPMSGSITAPLELHGLFNCISGNQCTFQHCCTVMCISVIAAIGSPIQLSIASMAESSRISEAALPRQSEVPDLTQQSRKSAQVAHGLELPQYWLQLTRAYYTSVCTPLYMCGMYSPVYHL